jgi:hypothetical protein
MRLAKGWSALDCDKQQTLGNAAVSGMIDAGHLRLMVRLPCAAEQINLAISHLVGEINADAYSCLLPGHGNYSFFGFGLGEQPT